MTSSTQGSGAGSTGPVEIMSEALSVADVLDRAADLIEPDGAWTQRTTARAADRRTVMAESPDAVCWCMGGAMVRVGGESATVDEAYRIVYSLTGGVVTFNDGRNRTQAEAVAKLREAANLAREQSA